MIAFVAAAWILQAPILGDPAFLELSKLVGGKWEGKLGEAVLTNRFEFSAGGRMVVSHGTVTVKDKVVQTMQANMGWDPSVKQVYYVDFHNHDIVYIGHISLKDGWMVFDFGQMSNPKAHFLAKAKLVDRDTYEFWVDGVKEATLKRS